MEDASQIKKRKACDVCYTKKIKCDLALPLCSNCRLYGTQCKTFIMRRRAIPKRKDAANDIHPGKTLDSGASQPLEARIASLEGQLQQLQKESQQRKHDDSWQHAGGSITYMSSMDDLTSGSRSDMAVYLVLPPSKDVIPTIERFFDQVNPFIPLFEERSFFRMLMEWYTTSSLANRTNLRTTMFAAINVVLALSYGMPDTSLGEMSLTKENPQVEICLRNIDLVMSHLINEDEDLLSLQSLLGLIMLYIGCKDAKPATILIGSAVQLCYRLFLNDREENLKFPPEIKLQRERVCLVTYILDKDISLRYHTAPLLSESDMEVDMPGDQQLGHDNYPDMPEDAALFDYFNTRIQLAALQGEVYDRIYSNSATPQKLTLEERRARMLELDTKLDNWHRSIPYSLQMENLAASSSGGKGSDITAWLFTHMAELYFTYMSCLVRVYGIWSHNAEWLNYISSFQRQAVRDCAMPRSRCGTQLPPLPKQWDKCAKTARECLRLAHCRTFNSSNEHGMHQLENDYALTRQGLVTFTRLTDTSNWKILNQLDSVVSALNESATKEVVTKLAEASVTATSILPIDEEGFAMQEPDLALTEQFSRSDWNFADDLIEMTGMV